MTNEQLIELDAGRFADWAEAQGYDYDDVCLWDMLSDLGGKTRMPAEFEISGNGAIPAELYDILLARKSARVQVARPAFDGSIKYSEWDLRGSNDGE